MTVTHRLHRHGLGSVLSGLLAALLIAACTSDGTPPDGTDSASPSSATPFASSQAPFALASPTPVATTRARFILRTPTPFPTAEAMAPDRIAATNARRTGVIEVDRVIDALFGDDQAALDALVRAQSAVCHEEVLGLGDMEVCPEGTDGGTLVEFFPVGSCHGYPKHDRPFVGLLDPDRTALLAVLRLPEPPAVYEHWPAGEYLLVVLHRGLEPARGATAYFIEGGELVLSQGGCNSVADLLAQGGDSPDYLLEPFALPE